MCIWICHGHTSLLLTVGVLSLNPIAALMPNTDRRNRRSSTVELSRVGVDGVYWA